MHVWVIHIKHVQQVHAKRDNIEIVLTAQKNQLRRLPAIPEVFILDPAQISIKLPQFLPHEWTIYLNMLRINQRPILHVFQQIKFQESLQQEPLLLQQQILTVFADIKIE